MLNSSSLNCPVEVFVRLQPPPCDHLFRMDDRTLRCGNKTYNFDYIFPAQTEQRHVFARIGTKVIRNALEGYNSCVFVYGQTGSGKTYTMTGNKNDGLLQRTLQALWASLHNYTAFECKMSCLEIYNECIKDLMHERTQALPLRENIKVGFYAQGLSQWPITSTNDISSLLARSQAARTVKQTQANSQSSRSHAIYTIYVTLKQLQPDQTFRITNAKLNFVDLAGSEKQKHTQAQGERLKEASNINKSLTQLSLVISKLAEQDSSAFIPYRNSVLTRLLKDSLGGNARTLMIVTLASDIGAISQTFSSLHFAEKAKKVTAVAVANSQIEGDNSALRKKVQSLEAELAELRASHLASKGSRSFSKESGDARVLSLQEQINAINLYSKKYDALLHQISQGISSMQFSECQLLILKGQNIKIQELKQKLSRAQFNSIQCPREVSVIQERIIALTVENNQLRIQLSTETNRRQSEMSEYAKLEQLQIENDSFLQSIKLLEEQNRKLAYQSAANKQQIATIGQLLRPWSERGQSLQNTVRRFIGWHNSEEKKMLHLLSSKLIKNKQSSQINNFAQQASDKNCNLTDQSSRRSSNTGLVQDYQGQIIKLKEFLREQSISLNQAKKSCSDHEASELTKLRDQIMVLKEQLKNSGQQNRAANDQNYRLRCQLSATRLNLQVSENRIKELEQEKTQEEQIKVDMNFQTFMELNDSQEIINARQLDYLQSLKRLLVEAGCEMTEDNPQVYYNQLVKITQEYKSLKYEQYIRNKTQKISNSLKKNSIQLMNTLNIMDLEFDSKSQ